MMTQTGQIGTDVGNPACTRRGDARRIQRDLSEPRCGYHGWTWDLARALKRVPNLKGFGVLRMAGFPLWSLWVDTLERYLALPDSQRITGGETVDIPTQQEQ
jgi:choline monooxygenase